MTWARRRPVDHKPGEGVDINRGGACPAPLPPAVGTESTEVGCCVTQLLGSFSGRCLQRLLDERRRNTVLETKLRQIVTVMGGKHE